MASFHKITHSG